MSDLPATVELTVSEREGETVLSAAGELDVNTAPELREHLSGLINGGARQISVDLAARYGESPEVLHASGAHHGDEEFRSVEAALVQIADQISASRPGARREMLESYVKRVQKLEHVADSYEGVEKAYAVQAGREIRIIVKPNEIDDYGAAKLAHDTAKKIEEELEFPGQIKVVVIRETRAVDFAR